MDPNTSWEIVQGDGSAEEKAEALRSLLAWHERGGFMPAAGEGFTRYAWWNRIAGLLASCEAIIKIEARS